MRKKLLAIILGGTMVFSMLTGCAGPGGQTTDNGEWVKEGSIEYDDSLIDSTGTSRAWDIVIKGVDESFFKNEKGKVAVKDYFPGATDVDFGYKEMDGKKINLYMSSAMYGEFSTRMKSSVMLAFTELLSEKGIDRITNNNNYSKITIGVDKKVYNEKKGEAYASIAGLAGSVYQIFSPEGLTQCEVNIVDIGNDQVISTTVYPNKDKDGKVTSELASKMLSGSDETQEKDKKK